MIKQQIPKRPIKVILCPNCQKHYLVLKTEKLNQRIEERNWHCRNPECHLFYPENWFDVFPQLERFVEREK